MSRQPATATTLLDLMGREARRFRPSEAAGVVEPLLDSGALRLDDKVIGLDGRRACFLADWLGRVRRGGAELGDADFAWLDRWGGEGWWSLRGPGGGTLLGGWLHDLRCYGPGDFQARQAEWARIFQHAPAALLTAGDAGRLLAEVLDREDPKRGGPLPSDALLARGVSAAARAWGRPVAMRFTRAQQWTAFLAAGGNPEEKVPGAPGSRLRAVRTSLWEYLLDKEGMEGDIGRAIGEWAEARPGQRARWQEHQVERLFKGVLGTGQDGIGGRVKAATGLPDWPALRGLDGRNLLMALLEDSSSCSIHAFVLLAKRAGGRSLLTAVDRRGDGLWARALIHTGDDAGVVVGGLELAGVPPGPDARGRGLLTQAVLEHRADDGNRYWLARRGLHDPGSAFYANKAMDLPETWLAASRGERTRVLARVWKTPALLTMPGLFGVAKRLALGGASVDAAWGEIFLAAAVCERHDTPYDIAAVADWALQQGARLDAGHVPAVDRAMGARPRPEQVALRDRLRLHAASGVRARRRV